MKLPWTRTWPGNPNRKDDGTVAKKHLFHPHDVLRVYRIVGGPQNGQWYWTASRLKPVPGGVPKGFSWSGYGNTKEEAQDAAEAAYFGE
jgi:hypothetical protein